jgi:hypothetical protein
MPPRRGSTIRIFVSSGSSTSILEAVFIFALLILWLTGSKSKASEGATSQSVPRSVSPSSSCSLPTEVGGDSDSGYGCCIKAAFSSRKENFWVSHRMCQKNIERGFRIPIKNKLQNPSRNCETNLMILINPSLAHVCYCSTYGFSWTN